MNPNIEEAALEEPEKSLWRGSILRKEDKGKSQMEIRTTVWPFQEAGIAHAKALE